MHPKMALASLLISLLLLRTTNATVASNLIEKIGHTKKDKYVSRGISFRKSSTRRDNVVYQGRQLEKIDKDVGDQIGFKQEYVDDDDKERILSEGSKSITMKFSIMLSLYSDIDATSIFYRDDPALNNALTKTMTRILCDDTKFVITTDLTDENQNLCAREDNGSRYDFDRLWDIFVIGDNNQNQQHENNYRNDGQAVLILNLNKSIVEITERRSESNPLIRWLELGIRYGVDTKNNDDDNKIKKYQDKGVVAMIYHIVDGTFISYIQRESGTSDENGNVFVAVSTIGNEEKTFDNIYPFVDVTPGIMKNDTLLMTHSHSNNEQEEILSTIEEKIDHGDSLRIFGMALFVAWVVLIASLSHLGGQHHRMVKIAEKRKADNFFLENFNVKMLITPDGVEKMLKKSPHKSMCSGDDSHSKTSESDDCDDENDDFGNNTFDDTLHGQSTTVASNKVPEQTSDGVGTTATIYKTRILFNLQESIPPLNSLDSDYNCDEPILERKNINIV